MAESLRAELNAAQAQVKKLQKENEYLVSEINATRSKTLAAVSKSFEELLADADVPTTVKTEVKLILKGLRGR